MKKVICLIIGVMLITIGISDVSALEKYKVVINGTPVVTNAEDNSVVSDYSKILTYENNVLTIKENAYITTMNIYDTITITSNDKQVYINQINNFNNTNPMTIKKLNSKSFDNLPFYMTIKGNVSILNSTIKASSESNAHAEIYVSSSELNIINSTIDLKGNSAKVNSSKNLNINNSIINVTGGPNLSSNRIDSFSGNVTIRESKINTDHGDIEARNIIITDSDVKTRYIQSLDSDIYIEKSDIFADYVIQAPCNISIIDSKVVALESSIFSGKIVTTKNGTLLIQDFEITIDEYIDGGGNVIIKGSTIKRSENPSPNSFSVSNSALTNNNYGSGERNMRIEDSDIYILSHLSVAGNLDILNSKVRVTAEGFVGASYGSNISVNGNLNMTNSTVITDSYISASNDLNVKGSDITINGINSTYAQLIASKDATIDNSEITMYDAGQYTYVSASANMSINKSTINIKASEDKTKNGSGYIRSSGEFKIEDSIYNSEIKGGSHNSSILIIKDSQIKTNGYFSTRKAEIENSILRLNRKDEEDCYFEISADNPSTLTNSILSVVGGFRTKGELSLKDSYLYTKNSGKSNWYSSETFSPLVVNGNLNIDNSRVIAESINDLPAVLVKGKIVLSEGSFKDNKKHVLEVEKKTVTTDNFLYNPDSVSNFGNSTFVSENDEVLTAVLNGNISTYAETEGYYIVTFKVVNGTWSDKTTEDKLVKVLINEEITDSTYPTGMIESEGFSEGSWEKTGDNEYTYTFIKSETNESEEDKKTDEEKIENPKTGIDDYTIVSSIFIVVLACVYLYIRKKGYFRKI